MTRSASLLFLLSLLLPTTSLADDGVVNELGTGIAPLDATPVRLEREVVVFNELGRRWAVTADLHFRNPTSEAQTLRLGFPADYWIESEGDPFIADLAVWVDGQPVALSLVPVEAPLADQELGWTRMYTFEVTFPPKQGVQILHQYTVEPAGDSLGHEYLTYVFATGATWGGSVGEARFVFRFDRPPLKPRLTLGDAFIAGVPRAGDKQHQLDSVRCVVPPEVGGSPASTCHYEYVAGPVPTLSLLVRDVEPRGEIHVQWGGIDSVAKVPEKPDQEQSCVYVLLDFHRSLAVGRSWPRTNMELLTCYEPAVLRNLVFAARGYRHTSDRYRTMFDGLFLPSDAPFEEGWMTGRETWMIEQLKGLEGSRK